MRYTIEMHYTKENTAFVEGWLSKGIWPFRTEKWFVAFNSGEWDSSNHSFIYYDLCSGKKLFLSEAVRYYFDKKIYYKQLDNARRIHYANKIQSN